MTTSRSGKERWGFYAGRVAFALLVCLCLPGFLLIVAGEGWLGIYLPYSLEKIALYTLFYSWILGTSVAVLSLCLKRSLLHKSLLGIALAMFVLFFATFFYYWMVKPDPRQKIPEIEYQVSEE